MTTERQETEMVMTTLGKSLREALRRMESLVTPKCTTIIGNWNVRIIYTTGAATQVAKEMREYRIDLFGISECRWVGAVLHEVCWLWDCCQREREQWGDQKRPGGGRWK